MYMHGKAEPARLFVPHLGWRAPARDMAETLATQLVPQLGWRAGGLEEDTAKACHGHTAVEAQSQLQD